MQLAVISAVLLAMAAAESGSGPVTGVAWRLVLVTVAALAAPLAALLGTHRLAPALEATEESEAAAARLEALVIGFWLAMVTIILLVAQWPRIVRDNWHLAAWPLVDELAVLLPVIAPLVLIWTAFYRLERAALVAACRERQLQPPPARLLDHVGRQVRHHLGLVLLPPLAIVGMLELLSQLGLPATQLDAAWWLIVPLLLTMLLLMPLAVRCIWRTSPLEGGPLREHLEEVCRGRHCSVRDILLWHTDGTLANAAVVGLSRRLRIILLTDVLVRRLSAEQVAAVVRHELAHLRRRHLLLRLALLVLPVIAWLAAKQVWPSIEPTLVAWNRQIGSLGQWAVVVIAPLGMLAYAVIVVGWHSRLLEHDADLDACLDDAGNYDPLAAEQFAAALSSLSRRETSSRWAHWMHPCLSDRLQFMERVAAEPGFRHAFRWHLAAIAAAIGAAYLAAILVMIGW